MNAEIAMRDRLDAALQTRAKTCWPAALREPLLQPPPQIAGRKPLALSVARTAPSDVSAFDPDEARRLCDALCAERVGGSFWGSRPILAPTVRHLVCVTGPDQLRRLLVGECSVVHLPSPEMLDDAARYAASDVQLIAGAVDPWHLFDQVETVVVRAGDPRALLARAAGCRVQCIDTGDELAADPESVAFAAFAHLVWRTAYRDPWEGRAILARQAIQILGEWRRWIEANRDIAVQHGMRRWKRAQMNAFLGNTGSASPHVDAALTAIAAARATGGAVAIWPSRVAESFASDAAEAGIACRHVEDGFLRSLGLGANLVPPQSITIDSRAPYYDARRPTDLEILLQTREFDPELLARARALRAAIVMAGLSKYGRSSGGAAMAWPKNRPRILVLGQVADDRSLRFGDPAKLGNAGLLRAARRERPDSYIAYKPHPDVLAGHRSGGEMPPETLAEADRVVGASISLPDLLREVDEVHVLSSLGGFEALLRGVAVICHGQPFYAGWGLTADRAPIPRRTRTLTLDQLVAGTLILYPRYLDPVSGLPCPPELLVRRLAAAPERTSLLTRLRQLQGKMRLKTRGWHSA